LNDIMSIIMINRYRGLPSKYRIGLSPDYPRVLPFFFGLSKQFPVSRVMDVGWFRLWSGWGICYSRPTLIPPIQALRGFAFGLGSDTALTTSTDIQFRKNIYKLQLIYISILKKIKAFFFKNIDFFLIIKSIS